MIQSNLMSAMVLLSPKTGDLAARNLSRTVDQKDDTFMNMLNERLQARTGSDSVKNRPVQKAEVSEDKNNTDAAKSTESKASTQSAPTKETRETKPEEASKATKEIDDKEAQPNAAENREETEETLSTLESLVALLEDLMAQLQVKTVEAEPVESPSQINALWGENQEIDPAELLKALLEGNTEKLKSLLENLDGSAKTHEFQSLLKGIEELINKLVGEQEEGESLFKLTYGDAMEGASREELIAQLKEQANEMINRLKEKINTLRQSLDQPTEESAAEGVSVISTDPQDMGQSLEESSLEKPREGKEAKVEQKESHSEENQVVHSHKGLNQAESTPELKDAASPEAMIADNSGKPISIQTDKVIKNTLPLAEKPMSQAVTNQVMMKVKLMAGENKQEMEMQLKPESLGKLSLKIIHERGEVLAKITAENEQVKGVLESNMQLLKDALEKNGFTVQSLSVSVGNGNDEGRANQDFQGQRSSGTKNTEGIQASTRVTEPIYTSSRDYYDQSSQINLTA